MALILPDPPLLGGADPRSYKSMRGGLVQNRSPSVRWVAAIDPVSKSYRSRYSMKEELAKLQGAWSIVALEVDGQTMTEGTFRGSQIVVSGNAFETISMGATYRGKLKVDPKKTPRMLDLLFEAGPEKGNRSLAIYELDGDSWRICLTVTGKKRPTAFATAPGSGLALEILKRGAAALDPLRAELALLEGEWTMVACERDGQTLHKAMIKTGKRLAKGNETTVLFGNEVILKAAYSLGVANRPKTIDYILTAGPNQGEMQLGIYELDGDTVRFHFAAPGQPRPSDFATSAGAGGTLAVWKRQKQREKP